MYRIAVTGGLSSGKSSVCSLLKEFGAHVVSADAIVHELLSPRHSTGQAVISLLGNDIIDDGALNRSSIAKKVFGNPALLQELERILHPAVRGRVEEEYHKALKKEPLPFLFVVEIPLLFETGAHVLYDAIIAVIASQEVRLQRFKTATGYGEEEFVKRDKHQLSQNEKARRADIIINNDGNKDDLRRQVIQVLEKLKRRTLNITNGFC